MGRKLLATDEHVVTLSISIPASWLEVIRALALMERRNVSNYLRGVLPRAIPELDAQTTEEGEPA